MQTPSINPKTGLPRKFIRKNTHPRSDKGKKHKPLTIPDPVAWSKRCSAAAAVSHKNRDALPGPMVTCSIWIKVREALANLRGRHESWNEFLYRRYDLNIAGLPNPFRWEKVRYIDYSKSTNKTNFGFVTFPMNINIRTELEKMKLENESWNQFFIRTMKLAIDK